MPKFSASRAALVVFTEFEKAVTSPVATTVTLPFDGLVPSPLKAEMPESPWPLDLAT